MIFGNMGRVAANAAKRGGLFQFGPEEEAQPPEPRRGLFGRMAQNIGQERGGVGFSDRLMAAGMALQGDGRGAASYMSGLQQQEQARQAEMRGAEVEQKNQLVASNQERESLYAMEDQFGFERGALAMLPESSRERVIGELSMRRLAPEAPDRPTSYQEYALTTANPTAEGYQRFLAANPRGTNVSVNTGQQGPQVGSIPAGYQLRAVDENNDGVPESYRMSAIEGGPVATAAENSQASQERFGGIVLDEIDRAIGTLAEAGPFTAGRFSAIGRFDPESQASNLQRYYDTIRANMGFDRLQAIRESSPTGGGVGSLSDPEREAMADTLGALDPNAPPEEQVYALVRIQNSYLDAIYGTPQQIERAIAEGRLPPTARQYAQRRDPNAAVQEYREQRGGRGQRGQDGPPPGVDPQVWEFMTPEERALWGN